MTDNFKYSKARRELHEEITKIVKDNDDDVTGVTGWILIAETADGPRQRSLYAISSEQFGELDLPYWTAQGWLEEVKGDVMFYLGPNCVDDDEDDEEY